MDGWTFSAEEVAELQHRYPRLALVAQNCIEGILDLDAEYQGTRVTDTYAIRIETRPLRIAPVVFETGGRIQQIATRLGIGDLTELHQNRDGTLCLCVAPEERIKVPQGTRLLDFVNDLVVPYFFGLGVRSTGQPWPWGERGHGGLGVLEYHGETRQPITKEEAAELLNMLRGDGFGNERWLEQLRGSSSSRPCPCGSGTETALCHELAFRGAGFVAGELHRLGITP